MGKQMKSVMVEQFGTASEALRFSDATRRPKPSRKEVLVQQCATSINIIDVARRLGYGKKIFSLRYGARPPMILGEDVCGEVIAVGSSVQDIKTGDFVIGVKPPSRLGTNAEFVAVKATYVTSIQSSLSPIKLAGVPYAFLTAWTALISTGGIDTASTPLQKIFVQGGAGAVGSMAVQIAKKFGCHVATSCSAGDMAFASRIGADQVFSRTEDDYTSQLSDFDVSLCCADPLEEEKMLSILKPAGGMYATVIHPTLTHVDEHGIFKGIRKARQEQRASAHSTAGKSHKIEWVLFGPSEEGLAVLGKMISLNQLIPPQVAHVFPLEETVKAHECVEAGSHGKVILTM